MGSMPPCSPSQPLARLGGQFFQLLVERKSLPPGSSLGVGQGRSGRSAPTLCPKCQSPGKELLSVESLFAKHGLGSPVVKKLHTPSTATYANPREEVVSFPGRRLPSFKNTAAHVDPGTGL